MAGIGPVPIMEGSTPACDQETNRAKGVSPRLSASDFFIRTTAAAPSFMPVKHEGVVHSALSVAYLYLPAFLPKTLSYIQQTSQCS
jgi:hypothetical protein